MESDTILSVVEARVLGALLEKSMATPEYYPLTLSSLAAACNQKSNRDPQMELDTKVVERVLYSLRQEKKLVTLVHEAGARVPKFEHGFQDRYGLSDLELAIMAELILRGPQTLAELKNRVPRMGVNPNEEQMEEALDSLSMVGGVVLVVKLPKAGGRRESRYAHQLCGEHLMEVSPESVSKIEIPPSEEAQQIEALTGRVETLEKALEDLGRAFEAFRANFE
ncbi:DUF480 domain-containing protein [Kiritimatiellaeota bacterium B1221]|nr:DUF480 domain-containing protein [Kiritimatiellaeota bacterium B1221]